MYIPKERRTKVDESVVGVQTLQDLIYAISTFILKMWNSAPTDDTLFVLAKELMQDPKNSKFVNDIRASLASHFTVGEMYTACRLAYNEFDQRIGRLHRALQCRNNGDIEGYGQAMEPLLAALGQEIRKETASQLIVPGGKV